MRFFTVFKYFSPRVLFSFGAIEAMGLILPLLALPWLGRVLGSEAFGLLMYMSIFPPIVFLIMDWGFSLGSVRAVAQSRSHKELLSELLAAVFSAKLILSLFCLCSSLIIMPFLPYVREYWSAWFLSIFLGLVRGINPIWFYQGAGYGLTRIATWDVCSSAVALLFIFIFIRSADQWEIYFLITAICKSIVYMWFNIHLWQEFSPHISFAKGMTALKRNKIIFADNFFANIYKYGSQLIFAYFLTATQIGIIAAVSKMIGATVKVINPINQTLFPEICIFNTKKFKRSRYVLYYSISGALIIMLISTTLIWILASQIISIALGNGYAIASNCLKIMSIAIPLMALNQMIATLVLISSGHERAVALTRFSITILSFPFAILFSCYGGLAGAAAFSVCMECCLFLGFLWIFLKLYRTTLLTGKR